MSSPNFIISDERNIPSIWYINSLLYFLNIIPDDYKKNDFNKFFTELSLNLKDSIINLDFEKLFLFENNVRFFNKTNNYYDNVIESFKNIFLNEKIKKIVEEAFSPVDMIFNYDNKC